MKYGGGGMMKGGGGVVKSTKGGGSFGKKQTGFSATVGKRKGSLSKGMTGTIKG